MLDTQDLSLRHSLAGVNDLAMGSLAITLRKILLADYVVFRRVEFDLVLGFERHLDQILLQWNRG
jgi:hypothetical protein